MKTLSKTSALTFAALAALTLAWAAGANLHAAPYTDQRAFRISTVFAGTTAEQQGLEAGDIIVSVDNHPVRSGNDLRYWLSQASGTAQLQVIDCNTGRMNQINVYPFNGKIGVDGEQVSLGNDNSGSNVPESPYGSARPSRRPAPVPARPPGIRPAPLPGR